MNIVHKLSIFLIILKTSFCNIWTDWENAKYLSKSIRGVVGGGNFTYYSLKCHGICKIELKSLKGDADLYVSERFERPTWEEYDYKADTCGLDVVGVADDQRKKVVYIGVYGHPFSDESVFAMSVYVDSEFYSSKPGENTTESTSIPTLILEILFELLKIVAEVLM
ncbi:unnamed protein product [Dimorphilus gyrociliatus]|uniref:Uncharacterized protein n=1 Tax=Dimorphilus gyrociliatus TaxID=2664684 RepID=A0A7I8W1D4_9ANNE|nr:unnamed protein product [Dimorphilus gyrociliatus]